MLDKLWTTRCSTRLSLPDRALAARPRPRKAHLDTARHALHQAGLRGEGGCASAPARGEREEGGRGRTLLDELDARPSLSFSMRSFSAAARSSRVIGWSASTSGANQPEPAREGREKEGQHGSPPSKARRGRERGRRTGAELRPQAALRVLVGARRSRHWRARARLLRHSRQVLLERVGELPRHLARSGREPWSALRRHLLCPAVDRRKRRRDGGRAGVDRGERVVERGVAGGEVERGVARGRVEGGVAEGVAGPE